MLSIFYHLFAALDVFIYSVAALLFRIIIEIANTQFFKPDSLNAVANRIYIVVGVLMLFKLIISGLQYIINPDIFDDKEKGLGGLLKKTALSLAMMVAAPIVFNLLMSLQTPIFSAIPTIIFGQEAPQGEDAMKKELEDRGTYISFTVLQSFVQVREKHTNDVGTSADAPKGSSCVGEGCQIHDFQSFYDHITEHCPWSIFGNMDSCTYDYKIILSTLCGGFLLYMLLGMALDVAIRTIKFGLIQMLAPIPISSYVFSKDKLTKFVKTATTVYADLFIRIAIIYFIIFAIKELIATQILDPFGVAGGGVSSNTIVNILIIFGLLMFASKAPKFITELLGLPEIGSGDFADMFKPAWSRAGGAAGAMINPLTNAATNFRQTWGVNKGQSFGKKLRRSLSRAAGGFGKGALDSVQGVMAGDDWAKMRQRHEAATQKSLRKAITAKERRKNKTEGNSRIQSIKDRIQKFRNDNKLLNDPATEEEAIRRYESAMDRYQKMGENIRKGMENGTLSGDALKKAMAEYTKLGTELSDRESWIQKEKFQVVADQQVAAQIKTHTDTITANNKRITEIDNEIAASGDTMTTEELLEKQQEKINLEADNLKEQAAIEEITHEKELKNLEQASKDKIKGANSRIALINDILKTGVGDATLDSLEAQRGHVENEINSQIADIDLELSSGGLSKEKVDELSAKKVELTKQLNEEINRIESSIANRKVELEKERDAEIVNVDKYKTEYTDGVKEIKAKQNAYKDKIVEEYQEREKTIEEFEKQGEMLEQQQRMTEKALGPFATYKNTLDAYFGGNPVTGKSYLDFSNLLGQTRSQIYTGEAMTKMRQNADILIDAKTKEPYRFNSKFMINSSVKLSYEEMVDIKTRLANHDISMDELKEKGFANAAMFGSAFEDVEKKAAAAYYSANIAMINGNIKVPYELKRPDLNSAIIESYDALVDALIKAGVPADQRARMLEDLATDPGKFMQNASTTKDLYAGTGKKIIDAQKKDDKN